ncbi:MAG: hypothetical protein ACLFUG_02465 [Nitriliruptoraceae bacterium]
MRRWSVLLTMVLAVLLLPASALADPAVGDAATAEDAAGSTILAVDDAPIGPEPAPRGEEENPARDLGDYADRETPFTWAAAWLLAGLGFIGLALLLLIYRFRVIGPERAKAGS